VLARLLHSCTVMFSEMANEHAKSHNRAGTLSDVSTPWRLNLMTERFRDVLVEEKLSRDGGGEEVFCFVVNPNPYGQRDTA
jgi:hypothetical protein